MGRPDLQRLDREYLTARGGAGAVERTVVVVGVGAVGSEAAANLAALGVGRLRLIDPDIMAAENVHRHILGVRHLGEPKVTALATELASRFPHLSFDTRQQRIEEVLKTDAAFVVSADLVVVALGDETLERRLTRLLAGGPPRVHAWVEPLGVGGHALLTKPMHAGCYECLYAADPQFGLRNRAALSAPGQEIRRSLAGCAGTFSPFSALDARRTALEAAELAARALTDSTEPVALVTWRGEHSEFEAQGYQVSDRARMLAPGARSRTVGTEFARTDCPVCGRAAAVVGTGAAGAA